MSFEVFLVAGKSPGVARKVVGRTAQKQGSFGAVFRPFLACLSHVQPVVCVADLGFCFLKPRRPIVSWGRLVGSV